MISTHIVNNTTDVTTYGVGCQLAADIRYEQVLYVEFVHLE